MYNSYRDYSSLIPNSFLLEIVIMTFLDVYWKKPPLQILGARLLTFGTKPQVLLTNSVTKIAHVITVGAFMVG